MASERESPEREQRVIDLIRSVNADTRAPHALRMAVGEMGSRRSVGRRPLGRVRARVAAMASGAAVAAVAAALAIAFLGGSAAPGLAQVSAVAGRGPAGPAPRIDRSAPRLLTARVGDLHFPAWGVRGGWRASGVRRDTVSGRAMTTVFYSRGGARVAYTIVAAPTLAGSHPPAADEYLARRDGGRLSVVWVERGHTCVLSSRQLGAEALWALARTTLDQSSRSASASR